MIQWSLLELLGIHQEKETHQTETSGCRIHHLQILDMVPANCQVPKLSILHKNVPDYIMNTQQVQILYHVISLEVKKKTPNISRPS